MSAPQSVPIGFQKSQPLSSWKGLSSLWTVVAVSRFLLGLPLRVLYFTPKKNRQNSNYSWGQAVGVETFRDIFLYLPAVRAPTPLPSKPATAWKKRFLLAEPASGDLYKGPLASNDIKPVQIPTFWYPEAYTDADKAAGKSVYLQWHGGGYVFGDPQMYSDGFTSKEINAKSSFLVCSATHRKSCNKGEHFPAQLQDAVTVYSHLLKIGVPADKIVIAGDSSGAHLALSLLRYINEHKLLPQPAAIHMVSPWVDLRDPQQALSSPNLHTDWITPQFTEWITEVFFPPSIKADDPYISPLGNPFQLQEVPLLLEYSSDEMFTRQIAAFGKEMEAVSGNQVQIRVLQDAPHDVMWTGTVYGMTDKIVESVAVLVDFLKKHHVL